MKKYFVITMLLIVVLLSGCSSNEKINDDKEMEKESFMLGTTLDDGRLVNFALDVPYKNDSLSSALLDNEISIDDFINELEYQASFKDGGSKLYKYNTLNNKFGNTPFYVLVCNSLDGIHDIFIAKHTETLNGLCSVKIDDLDGVSMIIKDGTLTKTGATVVITDTSDRENIYGISYILEKYENNYWSQLEPKHDLVFTTKGYMVDENNTLEFDTDWEYHYGKLKSGKYRIVKSVSEPGEAVEHYITAEFTIK